MPLQIHDRRIPCQIMLEMMYLVGRGERKTRIMYGANISYALLVKYLGFFEHRGFIEAAGDRYVVTEKGRVFIADLAKMLRHLEDETGNVSL